MKKTAGIHHITAIVGHPQENVDFYAGVLGMRMIKQTVNFDDPETYHLYFGNADGDPGTVITFFPWAKSRQGSIGDGQVGITVYAVPAGSLSFWENAWPITIFRSINRPVSGKRIWTLMIRMVCIWNWWNVKTETTIRIPSMAYPQNMPSKALRELSY